eukprot:scaffold16831_cov127-Isochrysis_galbana.AAC.5
MLSYAPTMTVQPLEKKRATLTTRKPPEGLPGRDTGGGLQFMGAQLRREGAQQKPIGRYSSRCHSAGLPSLLLAWAEGDMPPHAHRALTHQKRSA